VFQATVWDGKRRFYSGNRHRLLVFQTKLFFKDQDLFWAWRMQDATLLGPLERAFGDWWYFSYLADDPVIEVLGLTRWFVQWVKRTVFLKVNRTGREADNPPPSSAEMMDKVALGRFISDCSGLPFQYYFTNAPYPFIRHRCYIISAIDGVVI
jgi:hypothetical protein